MNRYRVWTRLDEGFGDRDGSPRSEDVDAMSAADAVVIVEVRTRYDPRRKIVNVEALEPQP